MPPAYILVAALTTLLSRVYLREVAVKTKLKSLGEIVKFGLAAIEFMGHVPKDIIVIHPRYLHNDIFRYMTRAIGLLF